MPVGYQLPGRSPCGSDTQTVNGIVKPGFKQLKQVFPRNTLFSKGCFKHIGKLALQYPVDVFGFLFFQQLNGIFRLFFSPAPTVHAGRVVLFLQCFAVSLYRFPELSGYFCFWTCISSHGIFPLYYTLLRFGGLQPLCGKGVTSMIVVTSRPTFCRVLIADSLPAPGPFTKTSIFLSPRSWAACPQFCAAIWAA